MNDKPSEWTQGGSVAPAGSQKKTAAKRATKKAAPSRTQADKNAVLEEIKEQLRVEIREAAQDRDAAEARYAATRLVHDSQSIHYQTGLRDGLTKAYNLILNSQGADAIQTTPQEG